MKETYEKPEIKTEVLEAGALAGGGSGDGATSGPLQVLWPLFGLCCD